MNRLMRIIVGLALIGYGFYSGNAWFYLGIIPLITGLINWCPMDKLMGGCKNGECANGSCCSPTVQENTSCCSNDDNNSSSCCSVPEELVKDSKSLSETKTKSSSVDSNDIVIKILGTGCANCVALKKVVDKAVSELGGDIKVIKEEDINEIMKYKVMSMPGLVINDKVVSTGKLLTLDEIKELIKKEQK